MNFDKVTLILILFKNLQFLDITKSMLKSKLIYLKILESRQIIQFIKFMLSVFNQPESQSLSGIKYYK